MPSSSSSQSSVCCTLDLNGDLAIDVFELRALALINSFPTFITNVSELQTFYDGVYTDTPTTFIRTAELPCSDLNSDDVIDIFEVRAVALINAFPTFVYDVATLQTFYDGIYTDTPTTFTDFPDVFCETSSEAAVSTPGTSTPGTSTPATSGESAAPEPSVSAISSLGQQVASSAAPSAAPSAPSTPAESSAGPEPSAPAESSIAPAESSAGPEPSTPADSSAGPGPSTPAESSEAPPEDSSAAPEASSAGPGPSTPAESSAGPEPSTPAESSVAPEDSSAAPPAGSSAGPEPSTPAESSEIPPVASSAAPPEDSSAAPPADSSAAPEASSAAPEASSAAPDASSAAPEASSDASSPAPVASSDQPSSATSSVMHASYVLCSAEPGASTGPGPSAGPSASAGPESSASAGPESSISAGPESSTSTPSVSTPSISMPSTSGNFQFSLFNDTNIGITAAGAPPEASETVVGEDLFSQAAADEEKYEPTPGDDVMPITRDDGTISFKGKVYGTKEEYLANNLSNDILLNKAGVTVITTGTKISGGVDTGEPCIIVGVSEKKALEDIDPADLLPSELEDGTKVDVVVIPKITFNSTCTGGGGGGCGTHATSYRPLIGGISAIETTGTACTIACIVKDSLDGKLVALTNNHCAGGLYDDTESFLETPDVGNALVPGVVGIDMLQPSPNDGGTNPSDKYGEVKRAKEKFWGTTSSFGGSSAENSTDCAVTSVDQNDAFTEIHDIHDGPFPFATKGEIAAHYSSSLSINGSGLPIWKSARTTGHVPPPTAYITGLNAAGNVSNGNPGDNNTAPYFGQLLIEGPSRFTQGGDSGAAILAKLGGKWKIVGLNFAGDAEGDLALANYISDVASDLSIESWDGSIIVPNVSSPYIQVSHNGRDVCYELVGATSSEPTHTADLEFETCAGCEPSC